MLNSIQSLRGIFAAFIFLHHAGVFGAGGDSGVCFFIILSGFVLCGGYQQRIENNTVSYSEFITRRIAKIYPLHLLCWAGAFALTLSGPHNPLVWLANLLLLQSWSVNQDVYFSANSVSWFLSVMLFCYLVFPPVVRRLGKPLRATYLRTIGLYTAYFIAIQFIRPDYFNIIYINPLLRLPDFCLGILLWQVICPRVKSPSAESSRLSFTGKSIVEFSATLLFILTVTVYARVSPRYGLASLWWPASIVLISIFSLYNYGGGIISRLLQLKPLVFFGDISFSFYMVHVLMLRFSRIILHKTGIELPPAAFIPFVFVLTAIVAYIVWRRFEKPVSQKLLTLLNRL